MSWFRVHRGWMNSHDFAKEPFTEREAWLWMVENAAYEAHKRYVSGHGIEVARGQLMASQRVLSDEWKWGRQRVRGFIAKLEHVGSITQNSTQGITIITVCNYERYQGDQPAIQPSSNPAATQQQPIKEKGKEGKERNNIGEPSIPEWMPIDAWGGFTGMRRSIKKPMTGRAVELIIKKLDSLRAQGHDIAAILDASTVNGWQDIYPPKASANGYGPDHSGIPV